MTVKRILGKVERKEEELVLAELREEGVSFLAIGMGSKGLFRLVPCAFPEEGEGVFPYESLIIYREGKDEKAREDFERLRRGLPFWELAERRKKTKTIAQFVK